MTHDSQPTTHNPRPHIVCDVDGVLAATVEAVVLLHCEGDVEKRDAILRDWPPGVYDLAKVLGKREPAAVWWKVDAQMNFWLRLHATPWCCPLFDGPNMDGRGGLRALASRLTIATVPRSNGIAHKLLWMREYCGEADAFHLVEPNKSSLAGPGVILIDDADHEVEAFRAAGGSAVLFPRRWNSRHAEAGPEAWRGVLEEVVGLGS